MFEKYHKIYQIGYEDNKDIFKNHEDEIIEEEKMDGANFRLMITDNNRIIFGSRNNSLGDDTQEIGGNWKRCVNFVKEKLENKELSKYKGLIIYGENMVKHSMSYDWEKIPPYLGFDIKKIGNEEDNNYYIPYDEKVKIFKELDLPMVPLIAKLKAGDIKEISDKDIPKSVYYEGAAEGVIFKNYRTGVMAKYVTEKFKEVNKRTFGLGKKFAENDDERLIATYCTNPRIDKCIFKLVDEGEKLELSLMHKLPKMVMEDIITENATEICMTQWSINFRDVRKKVSKRCFQVLQQVMTNNSLNK